jgi:hypothetical protein
MRHSVLGEHGPAIVMGAGCGGVVQIAPQRKRDPLASNQKFQQPFLTASRQF